MTEACKICQSPAPLYGVVDFNKSCESFSGKHFPLKGEAVWYNKCGDCGFLFTSQFDHWSPLDWCEHVYTPDYALYDPDGSDGARASRVAPMVLSLAAGIGATSMLDYGGGDGALTRLMRDKGIDARSFDPLREDVCPSALFPLITAFEVLEHTPTPTDTLKFIISRLTPGGMFLFSTLTLDGLDARSMDHWYIAPRNGHVSIHTTKSLGVLFYGQGFSVQNLAYGIHLARAVK